MNADFMNSIVQNMPVVLFVVDKDFKMKYVNPRFKDMFACEINADQVGRMIHCVTLENGGTCTHEELCSYCALRKAFSDCIDKGRDVSHRLIEKTILLNGKKHVISLKLTINRMDENCYVCVADDVTEILDISDEEREAKKRMLSEIAKAQNIQSGLLPKAAEGLKFKYIYRPLGGVGGDFFDIYKIDDRHIGAYIADVSGHGVSGGMLTVFLSENYNKALTSPAEALDDIYIRFNRYQFSENSYITMLALVIDLKERIMTYCNAGHGVPLLLKTRGSVFELSQKGAPISNWFKTGQYRDNSFSVNAGDRIMLFTDGVSDLKNGETEFGIRPLKNRLQEDVSLDAVIASTQKEIDAFSQSRTDDITILAMEV